MHYPLSEQVVCCFSQPSISEKQPRLYYLSQVYQYMDCNYFLIKHLCIVGILFSMQKKCVVAEKGCISL